MIHETVRQVMTTDVVTARMGTAYKKLVRLLEDNRVSALPVLDHQGKVVGVVSEADMLHRAERYGTTGRVPHESRAGRDKARALTAGCLMSGPALTVGPDTTVADAARLMERHRVKRLPVTDASGRLVGILARSDVLTVFLRPDREIHRDIAANVFQRVLWADPSTVRIDVRDGVVRLTGRLDTPAEVEIAERLCLRTAGVVSVDNRLYHGAGTAGAGAGGGVAPERPPPS